MGLKHIKLALLFAVGILTGVLICTFRVDEEKPIATQVFDSTSNTQAVLLLRVSGWDMSPITKTDIKRYLTEKGIKYRRTDDYIITSKSLSGDTKTKLFVPYIVNDYTLALYDKQTDKVKLIDVSKVDLPENGFNLNDVYKKYPPLKNEKGDMVKPKFKVKNTFTLRGTDRKPSVKVKLGISLDKSSSYYRLHREILSKRYLKVYDNGDKGTK